MISIDDLKIFLPNLLTITKRSDSEYQKILDRYLLRLKNLIHRVPSAIVKPHCLLDWINFAKKGDNEAKSFLSFVDQQSNLLVELLKPNFLREIKEILWKAISSIEIDTDKNENPDYLNHLGELFGLNHILTTGGNIFSLKQIEKELPNGKRVDFELENRRNKEFIHVDFLSIHGIDLSKIENNDDLARFLEYRLNQKIDNKKAGLPNNKPILFSDGISLNLHILPIIWTEIETLVPYKQVFKGFYKRANNALSFCSLISQKIEGHGIEYKFARVSDIITTWQIQKSKWYKFFYNLRDWTHKVVPWAN